MYVKTDKDSLVRIITPEMETAAEFSGNNIAQVTEHDGEVLLSKYPETFSEHTPDNS